MPVMRAAGLRFASLMVLLAAGVAAVAQRVQTKHAQIELLAQRTSSPSGAELLLGVHFMLEPGWHIYWTNPGDSGQPPVFKWQMPAGVIAGEILWPQPERIQSSPQLADYGY